MCISWFNICTGFLLLVSTTGVLGDDFEDFIFFRNLFTLAFFTVFTLIVVLFVIIICRICGAFIRNEDCHSGSCTTPVMISLPPSTGMTTQGFQGYDRPPPYSVSLPSAPPSYSFHPEINNGFEEERKNYI